MLKAVVNEDRTDWDDHLNWVLMAYRSAVQESTGCSPYLMVHGREMTLPLDVMVGVPRSQVGHYQCHTEYVEWLRSSLQRAYELARKRMKTAAQRQKNYYDARSKPHGYEVGNFVWRWYPPKANRSCLKAGLVRIESWQYPQRLIV
jgi:hypothetical protein